MISLDQAVLRQIISYSPGTGKFVWLHRKDGFFKHPKHSRDWNAKYAGKPAGRPNKLGYIQIAVFDKRYMAHHLAWLYERGTLPAEEIDHINHVRDDNRIGNLRPVSKSENSKNVSRASSNSSGVTGVSFRRRDGVWVAHIGINRRSKHLGRFKDFDAAVDARKAAEKQYGFHPNHGLVNA